MTQSNNVFPTQAVTLADDAVLANLLSKSENACLVDQPAADHVAAMQKMSSMTMGRFYTSLIMDFNHTTTTINALGQCFAAQIQFIQEIRATSNTFTQHCQQIATMITGQPPQQPSLADKNALKKQLRDIQQLYKKLLHCAFPSVSTLDKLHADLLYLHQSIVDGSQIAVLHRLQEYVAPVQKLAVTFYTIIKQFSAIHTVRVNQAAHLASLQREVDKTNTNYSPRFFSCCCLTIAVQFHDKRSIQPMPLSHPS